MKKPTFILISLFFLGLASSCNSIGKKDSHTSFQLSGEGNTYHRFFEMDGTSSDGQEYKLNVVYGYSMKNGTKIGTGKRQKAIVNSFITETIADYIKIKLSAKLFHEIMELKKINSDLENDIIEDIYKLNRAIEDQDIEVIKLDLTMRN